jgi:type IV secretory pathway VirB10-like protein
MKKEKTGTRRNEGRPGVSFISGIKSRAFFKSLFDILNCYNGWRRKESRETTRKTKEKTQKKKKGQSQTKQNNCVWFVMKLDGDDAIDEVEAKANKKEKEEKRKKKKKEKRKEKAKGRRKNKYFRKERFTTTK